MAFYNRAADQWMTMHPGKRICIYQMARLFTKIYNKVASVERGVEGFWASGLWPLEKDIFTEADFMVAEVIEEPEPIASKIKLSKLTKSSRRSIYLVESVYCTYTDVLLWSFIFNAKNPLNHSALPLPPMQLPALPPPPLPPPSLALPTPPPALTPKPLPP